MISCPTNVIFFCYNKEKFKEFKHIFCCEKEIIYRDSINEFASLGESIRIGPSYGEV